MKTGQTNKMRLFFIFYQTFWIFLQFMPKIWYTLRSVVALSAIRVPILKDAQQYEEILHSLQNNGAFLISVYASGVPRSQPPSPTASITLDCASTVCSKWPLYAPE